MRIRWIIVAAVMVSGTIGLATDATTEPATQSATRPAPTWATPKDAYRTFIRAYVTRDGLTLSKSVAWEDPSDEARIKLMIPTDIFNVEMFQLLAQQFPEDKLAVSLLAQVTAGAEKEKKGIAWALAETEQGLAKAEVVIDGESSTIKMRPIINGGTILESVKLKRVAGDWRVLPENVGVPYVPANAEMRAELNKTLKMRMRSGELQKEAQETFMKDLRAKKFASAKEALESLRQATTEAMKKAMAETNPGK